MRGDFEAYLNDEFRDESGKLDLNALLALAGLTQIEQKKEISDFKSRNFGILTP